MRFQCLWGFFYTRLLHLKIRYSPQGPANDHKKATKENHPLPSVFFNFGYEIWTLPKRGKIFLVPREAIGGKWIQQVMNPKRERPWPCQRLDRCKWSCGDGVAILGHRVGRCVWGIFSVASWNFFQKPLKVEISISRLTNMPWRIDF